MPVTIPVLRLDSRRGVSYRSLGTAEALLVLYPYFRHMIHHSDERPLHTVFHPS